jgi:sugar lactone lactonase YvrE
MARIALAVSVATISTLISAGCLVSPDRTNPNDPKSTLYRVIEGVVENELTLKPLEGVTITTDPPTSSVVTSADGRYRIEDPDPDEYSISASKTGFIGKSVPVTVASGTVLADITLAPSTQRGDVEGKVVDQNKIPIEGVIVTTYPSFYSVASVSNGKYLLTGLKEGLYSLSFQKVGYSPDSKVITVIADQKVTVDDLSLQPEEKGRIEGRVTDANGNNLEGVTITTKPYTITTDTNSQGRYSINEIDEREYTITASKDGFVAKSVDDIKVSGKSTVVVDIQLFPSPPKGGNIEGTVVNSDKLPLEGVTITTDPPTVYPTTEKAGRYKITGINAGSYTVKALTPDGIRGSTLVPVDVKGGETTTGVVIEIDTIPPAARPIYPADGQVINQAKPEFRAYVHDNEGGSGLDGRLTLKVDGNVVADLTDVREGTVNYTFESNLSEDSHVVSVVLKDNAGNSGTSSWSFTIDLTPPNIAISLPDDGDFVHGDVGISGTASDDLTLSLVEIKVDVGEFGRAEGTSNWTYAWDSRGSKLLSKHTLTAKATDTAGNTSEATVSLTYDVYVLTIAGGSVAGATEGVGEVARFNSPFGIAIDGQGRVYIADTGNHKIRKLTWDGSRWEVVTVAGSGVAGYLDALGASARFSSPAAVAVDSQGNIYVADTGNHRIRKIDLLGNVTTVAGSGEGYADGPGGTAKFSEPRGIAIGKDGKIYVVDQNNHGVRVIDANGNVGTLAGNGEPGYIDGVGGSARFKRPSGIAVDGQGNIYVADSSNNRIRKITPGGEVTTLAGSGVSGYLDSTVGKDARFSHPTGVAVDALGNIYVGDEFNNTIRKIAPDGGVITWAGKADGGFSDGYGIDARFIRPSAIAIDSQGNIYVTDSDNHRIRRVEP